VKRKASQPPPPPRAKAKVKAPKPSSSLMTDKVAAGRLIQMGVVTGAHGVRGAVTVKSFAENPEDLTAYGPLLDGSGKVSLRLRLTGQTRGLLIAKVEGIGDRTAALALKGTKLFLPRSRLPAPDEPESYYYADLIGLKVEDRAGTLLGHGVRFLSGLCGALSVGSTGLLMVALMQERSVEAIGIGAYITGGLGLALLSVGLNLVRWP